MWLVKPKLNSGTRKVLQTNINKYMYFRYIQRRAGSGQIMEYSVSFNDHMKMS